MNTHDDLYNSIRMLASELPERYAIPETYYADQRVKRGLRNADGTGVVIGVSKIGSVQG